MKTHTFTMAFARATSAINDGYENVGAMKCGTTNGHQWWLRKHLGPADRLDLPWAIKDGYEN
jgi:hypothetical protein